MIRRFYLRGGKRLGDILVACAGLVVFTIPMAWIAWRAARELSLSPIFRQPRVGYRGKEFVILKFRTMSEAGSIGPFSQRLRRTALDELPQLFNILRGEMSFVGPRPLIPEELSELDRIPQGDRRLEVRPGLTGMAQIYADKVPTLAERLRWDLEYVWRCSAGLDLWILLQSVRITLRGAWERPGSKTPGAGR